MTLTRGHLTTERKRPNVRGCALQGRFRNLVRTWSLQSDTSHAQAAPLEELSVAHPFSACSVCASTTAMCAHMPTRNGRGLAERGKPWSGGENTIHTSNLLKEKEGWRGDGKGKKRRGSVGFTSMTMGRTKIQFFWNQVR